MHRAAGKNERRYLAYPGRAQHQAWRRTEAEGKIRHDKIVPMKAVTLLLEDDAIIELYTMSACARCSDNQPDSAIKDLMETIYAVCDPMLSDEIKAQVQRSVDQIKEFVTTDSPDLYLLKAGAEGMIEKLTEGD
jgi:hypothetical protein